MRAVVVDGARAGVNCEVRNRARHYEDGFSGQNIGKSVTEHDIGMMAQVSPADVSERPPPRIARVRGRGEYSVRFDAGIPGAREARGLGARARHRHREGDREGPNIHVYLRLGYKLNRVQGSVCRMSRLPVVRQQCQNVLFNPTIANGRRLTVFELG